MLTGVAAVLHVGLCAGLGRMLLGVGVAWAKVATLAVLTVGVYLIAQRRYPIPYELGRVAKVLGVAVALFLASTFFDGLSPLLSIAIKAPLVASFPVVLIGIGFLEPGEQRWITSRARALGGRRHLVASTGRPR